MCFLHIMISIQLFQTLVLDRRVQFGITKQKPFNFLDTFFVRDHFENFDQDVKC